MADQQPGIAHHRPFCEGHTDLTKVARCFAKQFFQWHYKDGYTITYVKRAFDKLFRLHDELFRTRYLDYNIDKDFWDGRGKEWLKKLFKNGPLEKIKWTSRKNGGAPNLPFPTAIALDRLWFEDETCVDAEMNDAIYSRRTLATPQSNQYPVPISSDRGGGVAWTPIQLPVPITAHVASQHLMAYQQYQTPQFSMVHDPAMWRDQETSDCDAEGDYDDEYITAQYDRSS